MKAKLSNILLRVEDVFKKYPEMSYRHEGAIDLDRSSDSLAFEGALDFLTYFGCLSLRKWKRYADLKDFRLHLEISGDPCSLQFIGTRDIGINKNSFISRYIRRNAFSSEKNIEVEAIGQPFIIDESPYFKTVEIEVPYNDCSIIGFKILSEGVSEIRNAYWFSEIEKRDINPVDIAIVMTTYKKDEYVKRNIESLKETIFNDAQYSGNFHLYIIDNGNTLALSNLDHPDISVIPNPNVGGAGGFSRGMIAALEHENVDSSRQFSHVLLMDDDIEIIPESLIRALNLLRLADGKYRHAFLNGAMLSIKEPHLQFEDVASVSQGGNYTRVKGDLFVDRVSEITANEVIDVEVPRAYGAWWFSCIPVGSIVDNGLPLPLFVRCDDVEYGLRNNPVYMTMNGICVWHEPFDEKFNATMAYQSYRNQLITDALHGGRKRSSVPFIIERALRTQLRNLDYDSAELILESLEDYLKGPSFLIDENPQRLLEDHRNSEEELLPIDEAVSIGLASYPELTSYFESIDLSDLKPVDDSGTYRILTKIVRMFPYDKHFLPESLLRRKPVFAQIGEADGIQLAQFGSRFIVALDTSGEKGHIRVLDRDRRRDIIKRWHIAKKEYRSNEEILKAEYRDAMPGMTNVSFWKEYIKRAAV